MTWRSFARWSISRRGWCTGERREGRERARVYYHIITGLSLHFLSYAH